MAAWQSLEIIDVNGERFTIADFLGPMTLPCTGPLILSAFTIGVGVGTGGLLDGLAYFLAFGLGFGWPLVVLPFLAGPLQRAITRFLTSHHRGIEITSALMLVTIAIIGIRSDVIPALT